MPPPTSSHTPSSHCFISWQWPQGGGGGATGKVLGEGAAARRGRGAPGPRSHRCLCTGTPDTAEPSHLQALANKGCAQEVQPRRGRCSAGGSRVLLGKEGRSGGAGWWAALGGAQRQMPFSEGPRVSGRSRCPGCGPEPGLASPPAGRMACGLPPCPSPPSLLLTLPHHSV